MSIDEGQPQGDVKPRRRRRTREEIQAERELVERARQAAVDVSSVDTAPLPATAEKVKPIDAIAMMAANNINPSEYSDIYSLMKDCIRVKREYCLSDAKFMELMDRFDDRVVEENNNSRRKR